MSPERFKDSMSYLGIAYGKDFSSQELTIYYDFLKKYSDEIFTRVVKELIKKSKYLPKINELIAECEIQKEQEKNDVIDFMRIKGYFKNISEYEKTLLAVQRNTIPEWLKNDINHYYKMMKQEMLKNEEVKRLK